MAGSGPVVFLGTAEFAVPSLRALAAAGENVRLVVTQPDRPGGRGRRLQASPVKRAAQELGLDLLQPGDINAGEALGVVRELRPEFLVVVAFGQLLKLPLLEVPIRGAVNLHPSLLPRYRGASPIAWAVLAGDERVGVSTMLLDEGLDSGPVLLQEEFSVPPEATRGDLETRFAAEGARMIVETLRGVRDGRVVPRPQDSGRATLSGKLTREMRRVDWRRPAPEVRGLVHALSPSPGATVRLNGRMLKILRVRQTNASGEPGRVLGLTRDGPVVGCGVGALVLLEVHPEGRQAMTGADLVRGAGVAAGHRLEDPWSSDGPAGD